MSYQETLDWLFKQLPVYQRIGKAAYKADLNNTYSILNELENPHKKFKSIHIAGTNGKGSTAHMLASIYQEAGYKTGLYTSPHLRDFRERIRINGEMVSQEFVIQFIEKYKEAFSRIKPSFFEMTVGMAFAYFAEEQVDIAIIETGLGGRLDSTNVISPKLSIITNIGKDHMQFLGNSLKEIAGEKAGIIKTGIPVIIGEHQAETNSVFIEKANSVSTELTFAQDSFSAQWQGDAIEIKNNGQEYISELAFPLKGEYQLKNICTAICASNALGFSPEIIKKGLCNFVKNTSFAGRWQILSQSPVVLCDTAHNQEGLVMVMKQLTEMDYKKLHIVLGVVDDKDLDKVLKLFPQNASYYFCKADIPRGLDANILSEKAHKHGLFGEVYPSVNNALEQAKEAANSDDLVFVGGSTFTVAEVV